MQAIINGVDISPILTIVIPALVLLLRNALPKLADSRGWTLFAVAVLGALGAVAEQLGIPLGTDGQLLTGLLSGLAGIGVAETAKSVPALRKANRSKER